MRRLILPKSLVLTECARKRGGRGLLRYLSVVAVLILLESSAFAMAGGGEGEGGGMMSMLPLILIVGIMYFILIRPQQKRQKDVKLMQGDLKVGDRITTSGGIHGTIAAVSESTVSVKVAEKMKLEIDRTAIAGVRSPSTDSPK